MVISFCPAHLLLLPEVSWYSAEFLGKKCTAFYSLISYALKFTPRWHTGKSELCYWVRALIGSFGTKCCKVISSMRQESLPPCKHTPANPELTHTETMAPCWCKRKLLLMASFWSSETRLTGGGVGETNYVSNSQLFQCTIQFENSLADCRVQFACTNAANGYPSNLEKTDTVEGNF